MTTNQESLEQRLRDALRQQAQTTPFRDQESSVPGVLSPARGPRRLAAAMVAALGVAAAVALFVALTRADGGQRVATLRPAGDSAPGTSSPPRGSGAPSARPPRLLVDLPGTELTRVSERSVVPVPRPDSTHLQVYRSKGEATPLLFVEVVPPSASFGFGEQNPSAERRSVNGRPAYLNRDGDRVISLGIPGEGGGGVFVLPFGLDADEVITAAEALAPRSNGAVGLDAVRPLPRGLALAAEGGETQPGGIYLEAEMSLPAGGTAQLKVEPAGGVSFERLVKDRVAGARSVEAISVLDQPGFLVVYAAPADDTTIMWQPAEGWTAELRAPVNAQGMRSLAGAVRHVDDSTWIAAMPDDAVTPDNQASEATRLQADIPLPPGATWASLDVGNLDPDRYQFNIAVAKHGLCAWVKELRRATSTGNTVAARRAVDAIAGAPRWISLQEVDAGGAYPEVVASIAQFLAEGRPLAPEGPPDMAQLQAQGQSVNPEMAFGC